MSELEQQTLALLAEIRDSLKAIQAESADQSSLLKIISRVYSGPYD